MLQADRGFDNRCLLDALDRAEGRLLGVAVPAPDSTADELEAMHRRGVRGIRCNLLNANGLQPEAAAAWLPLLAELGWHVAFHMEVEAIGNLRSFLRPFTVPVVIDHMGHPRPGGADPDGALLPLVDAIREGGCFVKLSAPYRLSHAPPPWSDVAPLARALIDANPAACLWASDWPFVDTAATVRTEDVVDALEAWCPSEDLRRQVTAQTAEWLLRRT